MQRVVESYLKLRYLFFRWRYELTTTKKLLLSLTMAAFTGLLAQIYIVLPFTPVPITGQVFGVLMSGVICGRIYGSVSQIFYVSLGLLGLPWFACGRGGISVIFSPTWGYFLGFILAPLLIGNRIDKFISSRNFWGQMKLMLSAIGVIYLFGSLGLAISLGTTFFETMVKGVIPFIPVDIFKAILCAVVSSSILPKRYYNDEIDKDVWNGGDRLWLFKTRGNKKS